MNVYVRWYGKVVEGELLDGEHLGMKLVRIPLDGHHPVAMFTPQHVYRTDAEASAQSLVQAKPKNPEPKPQKDAIEDIMPDDDRLGIEAFKEAYWDHERNHLRIDKLDEFYFLWRMAMTPFGFAEIPADQPEPKAHCRQCANLDYDYLSGRKERVAPDEHFCGLHGRKRVDPDGRQKDLNHKGGCGFIRKPQPRKPTKKQMRSSGEIEFTDSTQLSLFD